MIAVWCAKCQKRIERFSATDAGVRAWCHGQTEHIAAPNEMAWDSKTQLATLTMFKEPKQPLTDALHRAKIDNGGGDGF